MNERTEIKKYLTDLLAYYHKPANTTVLSIWLEECKSFTQVQFYEAVRACLKKYTQMPTVDEFLALVVGDRTSFVETQSLDTWQLITKASCLSPDDEFRKTLPSMLAITERKALVELGGLNAIALCLEKDLIWKKKEFLRLCQVYQSSEEFVQKSGLTGSPPISLVKGSSQDMRRLSELLPAKDYQA